MADNDDDGMTINLTPFDIHADKKSNKHNKKNTDQKKKVHDKKNFNAEKTLTENKVVSKHHKKRPYIDPKDFTPVSTLFNKNPEVPVVPNIDAIANVQEVVFTSDNVSDLPVNHKLLNNLRDQFKFTSLTKVQKLSIPVLLSGKDCLIKSPTGSGKTMCYSIPIVEKLTAMTPPVSRSDGPYAIISLPTRELALQTFYVMQDLCKSCVSIVPGLLLGGEKCKSEKARLRKGVNIVIATPGRLLYHLQETACLDVSKVMYLVFDEGDKLFDMGFEKTVKEILAELEKRGSALRQTVMLSATLSQNVTELASSTLKDPTFIDSELSKVSKADMIDTTISNKKEDFVVPASLLQYFVIVPAKMRLVSLISFVVKKAFLSKVKSKVIVFMSTINIVAFSMEVLKVCLEQYYNFDVSKTKFVHMLHGDMTQPERTKTFEKFKVQDSGILFSTDVAARGLDIKAVDWIIQYSCPAQIEDYLHRVGRTARIGEKGKSLLFLLPSEVKYVTKLGDSSVVLNEMKSQDVLAHLLTDKKAGKKNEDVLIEEKATELQMCMEEAISKSSGLKQKGMQAYKSFIQGYATYPSQYKDIFHVKHLHLGHVAKSFGLREAPNKFGDSKPTNLKRKYTFDEEKERKERAKKARMQRAAALSDGIFTGPRPGKQKVNTYQRGGGKFSQKSNPKKRKIRI